MYKITSNKCPPSIHQVGIQVLVETWGAFVRCDFVWCWSAKQIQSRLGVEDVQTNHGASNLYCVQPLSFFFLLFLVEYTWEPWRINSSWRETHDNLLNTRHNKPDQPALSTTICWSHLHFGRDGPAPINTCSADEFTASARRELPESKTSSISQVS